MPVTAPAVDPRAEGAGEGGRRALTRAAAAVAVVGVVAVGVGLRLLVHSKLWLDEALTVNIASLPLADLPAALRRDGHPPLYYVVLHGWMKVFGSGDHAVRWLSAVFALICLPLVWIAADRLGGRRGALGALTLFALSPFVVRYSTEARMYSLVMVLVLTAWLLVDDLLRRPSRARTVGLALVTGALVLTQYWCLYLLVVAVIALLVRWRRVNDARERRLTRSALLAIGVGTLAFLPWLPSFLHQLAHTGTPWGKPSRPTTIVSDTLVDMGGVGPEGVVTGALLLIAFLLGVFGRAVDATTISLDLRTDRQTRRAAVVIAATMALGALAALASRSVYASRYAAVVVPLVIVVAAIGLTRFASRPVWAGALVVMAVASTIGGVEVAVKDRTQAGAWISALEAGAEPGDVVVFCPDQLGPAGTRGLRDDLTVLAYPTLGDPRFVDWTDYADRNASADPAAAAAAVESRAASSASIWVVWSPAYRTLANQCEAFTAALGVNRVPRAPAVEDDGALFTEHGWLVQFAPRT